MIRRLVYLLLAVLAVSFPEAASAATTPFYVAAHVSGKRAIASPQRFNAVVGWRSQCVAGIPCWRYVKGSRSPDANLPERWYVHVNGQRVHDAQFHYFVMNPNRRGWQRHVARECGARCFLDGLGPTSVVRTQPRLNWTVREWVKAAARLVVYVHAHHRVLPNSIGKTPGLARRYLAASGGRGSTEHFTPQTTWLLSLGRVWVQEVGDCQAKWRAYQGATDGNDHFSCHEWHTFAWDDSWWSGS